VPIASRKRYFLFQFEGILKFSYGWWQILQEDNDIINSWNLRKCSAIGSDILSTIFGDEIFPILMPLIQVIFVSCGTWNLCCCKMPYHVTL
jgi:hypothetical protein